MKTHKYMTMKPTTGSFMHTASPYVIAIAVMLMLFSPAMHAQEAAQDAEQEYSMPNWFFGIAGAANFNFYEGTTRQLSESSFNDGPFIAPAAFHDGFGIKPYFAGLVEYRFNDMWGINLNFGFDGRGGLWDEIMAPCDCPSELETNLSYLVVEPSLRFAPFRGNFHLFAGPRLSLINDKDFTYTREQQFLPDEWKHEAELSETNDLLISAQIGAGYDIVLSKATRQTKWVLTPFVSFHPYFGQVPRDIESWSITTVRAGLALKVGRGIPVPLPEPEPVVEEVEPEVPEVREPPVVFDVRPPILTHRRITNEVFPLRNYVFFDKASTDIPDRYNLLSTAAAGQFSEEGLRDQVMIDRRRQGDSQMQVYYHILNIVGDRMRNNPNTSITLASSSAGNGLEVAQQQAEAVEMYLVRAFNIDPDRIDIRTSEWPEVRSYRHHLQEYTELRLDSDRRVEILSSDPVLLMGDDRRESDMLNPVMFSRSDEGRTDSHVIFNLSNAERHMEEWYVELTDPTGVVMEFGPFTSSRESVPAEEILDRGEAGTFQALMKGVSNDGLEFTRETTVDIRDVEITETHTIRFSMLYEFDKSVTPPAFEHYLVENVVPLVTENARIIIHGHTDKIGTADHNQALSLQRARDAKQLVESALRHNNIEGVEFEVYGFGEMTEEAPFPNDHPEQRFYNRTVIIDIMPR